MTLLRRRPRTGKGGRRRWCAPAHRGRAGPPCGRSARRASPPPKSSRPSTRQTAPARGLHRCELRSPTPIRVGRKTDFGQLALRSSQRQIVPRAAPSFGQPGPISRLGRAGQPYGPTFPLKGAPPYASNPYPVSMTGVPPIRGPKAGEIVEKRMRLTWLGLGLGVGGRGRLRVRVGVG